LQWNRGYETNTCIACLRPCIVFAVAYYNGEAAKGPAGKLIERGISTCEMIYDGKRWWIASDIWDDIGNRPWPADLDSERQR